ncbi:MAG: YkgJ family cysteine cluster protein [Phycisphaerae bacterium]
MKCQARCCRYFGVPLGRPETYEDFDEVRWYLLHRGVSVYIDAEGDWGMRVENRCRMLRKTPRGWRCVAYGRRPLVCRRFAPATCEFTRGFHEVEEHFASAAELEAYASRMLGRQAFEDGRRAASRKRRQSGRRRVGRK